MTFLHYVQQVRALFDRAPSLARARAVYAVRSFARGDIRLGRSDIDLVVVLPAGADDAAHDGLLSELRSAMHDKRAWGLSSLSVPKISTALEWRDFALGYPADFGHPTLAEARLLTGDSIFDDTWRIDARALADDIEDGMLRHLVNALLRLTKLLEGDRSVDALAPIRKTCTRFLRMALWKESGAYVDLDQDVRSLARRAFGAWVGDVFEGSPPYEACWRNLVDVYLTQARAPEQEAAAPVDAEVARAFEWHSSWFQPRFATRAFVLARETSPRAIERVLAEAGAGLDAAIVPSVVARRLLSRVLPHAGLALADPRICVVPASDVALEARRILAHHRANWRNMYLDWPEASGRIDGHRLGHRLVAVLEAMLTEKTGEVVTDPRAVPARFRASFEGWPGLSFVESFVEPALAGSADADVWLREFPAFARAI